MKNIKFMLLNIIALGLLVGLGGCASKYSVSAELEGAPKWVMTPDILQSSASAKIKNNNINFAKTLATTRARAELAKQFQTKIKSIVKDFDQQTGVNRDNSTEDAVSSSVIQDITSQTLNGSRVKDIWISKTNTLWALVEISQDTRDKLKQLIKNSILSSYNNKNATHQQNLSKEAHKDLDRIISREF